ncbi:hypothetical protein PPERSA_09986 [Pseudocohnilembus persalinus]|uniref:Uncharacterized protein n=1 Tax=Pseudocohnilembus persalinus TaxID=266149 RepID=A0A0V0QJH5_PSEPJ|nr:hypothetical protein PPERSA_09986 [Pseudocohnilembus persalinus]|eukprot:KRX02369.1 hypothetical protein PPERSA_09986 [Pseudocohnilembus persalinus]
MENQENKNINNIDDSTQQINQGNKTIDKLSKKLNNLTQGVHLFHGNVINNNKLNKNQSCNEIKLISQKNQQFQPEQKKQKNDGNNSALVKSIQIDLDFNQKPKTNSKDNYEQQLQLNKSQSVKNQRISKDKLRLNLDSIIQQQLRTYSQPNMNFDLIYNNGQTEYSNQQQQSLKQPLDLQNMIKLDYQQQGNSKDSQFQQKKQFYCSEQNNQTSASIQKYSKFENQKQEYKENVTTGYTEQTQKDDNIMTQKQNNNVQLLTDQQGYLKQTQLDKNQKQHKQEIQNLSYNKEQLKNQLQKLNINNIDSQQTDKSLSYSDEKYMQIIKQLVQKIDNLAKELNYVNDITQQMIKENTNYKNLVKSLKKKIKNLEKNELNLTTELKSYKTNMQHSMNLQNYKQILTNKSRQKLSLDLQKATSTEFTQITQHTQLDYESPINNTEHQLNQKDMIIDYLYQQLQNQKMKVPGNNNTINGNNYFSSINSSCIQSSNSKNKLFYMPCFVSQKISQINSPLKQSIDNIPIQEQQEYSEQYNQMQQIPLNYTNYQDIQNIQDQSGQFANINKEIQQLRTNLSQQEIQNKKTQDLMQIMTDKEQQQAQEIELLKNQLQQISQKQQINHSESQKYLCTSPSKKLELYQTQNIQIDKNLKTENNINNNQKNQIQYNNLHTSPNKISNNDDLKQNKDGFKPYFQTSKIDNQNQLEGQILDPKQFFSLNFNKTQNQNNNSIKTLDNNQNQQSTQKLVQQDFPELKNQKGKLNTEESGQNNQIVKKNNPTLLNCSSVFDNTSFLLSNTERTKNQINLMNSEDPLFNQKSNKKQKNDIKIEMQQEIEDINLQNQFNIKSDPSLKQNILDDQVSSQFLDLNEDKPYKNQQQTSQIQNISQINSPNNNPQQLNNHKYNKQNKEQSTNRLSVLSGVQQDASLIINDKVNDTRVNIADMINNQSVNQNFISNIKKNNVYNYSNNKQTPAKNIQENILTASALQTPAYNKINYHNNNNNSIQTINKANEQNSAMASSYKYNKNLNKQQVQNNLKPTQVLPPSKNEGNINKNEKQLNQN